MAEFWLFDCDLPAIVEASVGFVLTVVFSRTLTRALRRYRGNESAAKPAMNEVPKIYFSAALDSIF
jgi:hypothetical protein